MIWCNDSTRNLILIAPADVIKSAIMGMWSHQSVLIDAKESRKSTTLSLSGQGWIITVLSQLTSNVTMSWEGLDTWAHRFQGKKWSYIFSIHGMTCNSLSPCGGPRCFRWDLPQAHHTVCSELLLNLSTLHSPPFRVIIIMASKQISQLNLWLVLSLSSIVDGFNCLIITAIFKIQDE